MNALNRRLAALEALPRADELAPCPLGMVRHPGTRNFFYPAPMSLDEWERAAREQQAALIAEELAHAEGSQR